MVGLASRRLVLAVISVVGVSSSFLTDGVYAQAPSDGQAAEIHHADCKILYLGIVGGLETPNNRRSGIVQIRDMLQGPAYTDVCARTFSPYDWMAGRSWILRHFGQHPGPMTEVELDQGPKVVLVGHSLGGWAVLSVARSLERQAIPVELAVQVDSVGLTDHTVPRNVREAAIFHARDILIFLTTKTIKAEDPSRTKLVENIRVTGVGHESITRDVRIRELVLRTVNSLRADTASADSRRSDPSPQGDEVRRRE
jgi:pimeloyl-ACP methyl ester carboxylesterase